MNYTNQLNILMPKQSENNVVHAICQYLEYRPHFFWRQNSVGVYDSARQTFRSLPKYAIRGVPDILVLAFHTIVFVECKTDKGVQSQAQKDFQMEVESRGYTYILARSVDDVINAGL